MRRLVSSWSLVVVATTCWLAVACASSKTRFGWDNEANPSYEGVDGAALHAGAMTYRKPMPAREENKFDFYYKHCDLDGDQAFYSKTSYFCTEP